MTEKSHVSVERKKCPVCCVEFDSGAILLDKRLKPSMERFTTTGWQMCEKCDGLRKEGYIALIVADSSKSGGMVEERTKLEDAYRTGEVMHIRRTVAEKIFTKEIKEDLCFIDVEAAEVLRKMASNNNTDNKEKSK